MDEEAVSQAAELINSAERPLVLVGQGVELGDAQQELRAFIEKARNTCRLYTVGTFCFGLLHILLNKGMHGMHGNLGPNTIRISAMYFIAVGNALYDRVTGKLDTYAQTGENHSFRYRSC